MNRTAVLVEGESDRAAVVALAVGRGVDLGAAGIVVVAMGGITNVMRQVAELGPHGAGLRLVGLYDAAEERFVRKGLQRGGVTVDADREGLSTAGFHCCDRDLEDELIRALGMDRAEAVLAAQGDLGAFRTLQRQPAHRGGAPSDHLRRFLGAGSGRKTRYARLLVEALDDHEIPQPLAEVLTDAVARPTGPLAPRSTSR